MTNKEALFGVVRVQTPDDAIEKAFLDRAEYNLLSESEYHPGNEKAIDHIAYTLLINHLDADISEGGYSISYKDSIQSKINRLSGILGFKVPGGVEDASYMW